jgi:hypothetical protein
MAEVSQWVKEEVHKYQKNHESFYKSKISTLQNALDSANDENYILQQQLLDIKKQLSKFVGSNVDQYLKSHSFNFSNDLTLLKMTLNYSEKMYINLAGECRRVKIKDTKNKNLGFKEALEELKKKNNKKISFQ